MQDVLCCEISSLWIVGVSNALSSFRQIVARMPELDIGSQKEPVGARFPERHARTAGIHDSNPSDRAVKLHVGMTADDHRRRDSFEDRQESIFGRKSGVNISVSLRGVA